MNNRRSIRCAIIQSLLILIVLPPHIQSSAQSQKQSTVDSNTKADEQIIRCELMFVSVVKVEVTNHHGKEVADLKKDDFIIYEDGVKQELMYWKRNVGSDSETGQAMYEAGYYPTNFRFRGEWRKVRVLVRRHDHRKLKTQFTPKGYYAKKELIK